jgi:hypothetical protein
MGSYKIRLHENTGACKSAATEPAAAYSSIEAADADACAPLFYQLNNSHKRRI